MQKEFNTAYNAQTPLRTGWTEKENMLISKLGDSISVQFKTRVTDSRLATIVIERSARVMAQVPTGTVHALTKKDKGKSALMSLVLGKYIVPGDEADGDHLTKMRMVDMYSQVYGVQPVLYDITVTEDYLGPGTHLLPIRSWFPQPGKRTVDDSDYNYVETYVSASWLEGQKGRGSWDVNAIDEVLSRLKDEGGESKANRPQQDKSVVEVVRDYADDGGAGEAGQIRLITRYGNRKNGKWVTFVPRFDDIILRDCPNRDGHIPIVLKHHIPLIDSIYGLGAFERGKTLQYAMDSLNAMYLAGVAMHIFPPRIVNPEGVVVASLDYAPAATWEETVTGSIRNYEISPTALGTFQNTYSWLTGALLNQNGTTDTTSTAAGASDPTAGKTPQALALQKQREGAADNWDRFMMEAFLQRLYERMINLVPMVPKPFSFHIFDAEIKQIEEAGLKDVAEVFESGKAAEVTAGPQHFGKGIKYRYIIDPKSTKENDDAAEHVALDEILKTLGENPQLNYYLQSAGKQLDYAKLIERWVQTGGLTNGDEIVSDLPKPKMGKDGKPVQSPNLINPMLYPSKKLSERVDILKLPLWAQVQMMPMLGVQVPDAIQQYAIQLATQNPEQASKDPNAKVEQAVQPDDPNHEFLLKWFDQLSVPAQRKIAATIVGPEAMQGILPAEAKMVQEMSSKGLSDSPAAGQEKIPEIDPGSGYTTNLDEAHAHLASTQDPATKALYDHIMSSAKPGVPLEATPVAEPGAAPAGVA